MSTIGESRCYLSTESAVADPLPAWCSRRAARRRSSSGGRDVGDAGRGHRAVRRTPLARSSRRGRPATTTTPTTRDAGGHDVRGRSRPTDRRTRFAGQVPQGRHRRHRRSAARARRATCRRRGRPGGPRCRSARPDAKPNTMLMTMMNASCGTRPRLSRSTGWWIRPAVRRTPNSPKIAPDAPTDGTSPPNTKLAVEPGRCTCQVEHDEPDGAVPALDDQARQVQRVHVEAEVKDVAVEEGHRPQPPVLARGHGRLVELEPVEQAPGPPRRTSAVSETTLVTAMIRTVAEMSGRSPRPRAKYFFDAPTLPVSLLSQPRRFAISALSSGGARRSASR